MNFAKFRDLDFWDFKSYFGVKETVKHKFEVVKLKEVIQHRKEFITINDEEDYKRCRVQLYAKGIVLRDIIKGSDIVTKKQQLCETDELLVAEIDAKFGGYGIVPAELEGAIVSSHYFLYEIDKSKLLPNFLGLYLKTDAFARQVQATGSTNYAAIRPHHVLEYRISLPPIEKQNELVEAYEARLSRANECNAQADALEQEIETYLLDELGIEIRQTEAKKGLQFVRFKDLNRWDVPFLSNVFELTSKFPKQNLSYFINQFMRDSEGNSLRFESYKFPEQEFNYLGMENVEKDTGELVNMPILKGDKIKSQTIKVPKDYIIYGKLRPYLNKYWHNLTEFQNIICSSEFFVFDIKENINQDYFKILLSSVIVQKQISNNTSGVRMPRMSEKLFFNLEIPLPPLEIQEKIVAHIGDLKAQIKKLKIEAENLRSEAKTEFEREVFEI